MLHLFRLQPKYQTRLERLARGKHSSLLQKLVYYGCKKFYNVGPWFQCYKTFLFVADSKDKYARVFVAGKRFQHRNNVIKLFCS